MLMYWDHCQLSTGTGQEESLLLNAAKCTVLLEPGLQELRSIHNIIAKTCLYVSARIEKLPVHI